MTSSQLSTLLVFPDTNVFLHCHPFDQWDWSIWGSYDEVHMILCRPVHSELENLKNARKNRIRKRARKALNLVRDALTKPSSTVEIREADPPVRFVVDPLARPNPQLENALDFCLPDHALVGIVHGALVNQSKPNALLLTDDTGVIAVASAMEVPFFEPLPSWKTPPEITIEEREIAGLKAKISEFEDSFPKFEMSCLSEGELIQNLNVEFVEFDPLSEEEIEVAISGLKSRLLPGTTFNQIDDDSDPIAELESCAGSANSARGAEGVEMVIAGGASYEEWIGNCKKVLRQLHKSLHWEIGQPWFCFSATNSGSCPADSVLVRVSATGALRVARPPFKFREDSEFDPSRIAKFPSPPLVKKRTAQFALTSLFDVSPAMFGVLERGLGAGPLIAPPTADERRDPNSFYYRRSIDEEPVELIEFTCEQWRHRTSAEFFEGRVFPQLRTGQVRGSLTIEIHAANLRDPATFEIPVRLNNSRQKSFDYVGQITQDLCRHTR